MQIRQVCRGAVGAMTGYILRALWDKYTDPHSICHKIKVYLILYSFVQMNTLN